VHKVGAKNFVFCWTTNAAYASCQMGRNAFHNFFGNGPSLSLAPFYNELLSQYNVAIVVAIGVCIYVCVSGNLIKYSIAFLDGVPSVPMGRK